jgi:hypothetical protein
MTNIFAAATNTDALCGLIQRSESLLINDSNVYYARLPFEQHVARHHINEHQDKESVTYKSSSKSQHTSYSYLCNLPFFEEFCKVSGPHAKAYIIAKKYSESLLLYRSAHGLLSQESTWLLTPTHATSLRRTQVGNTIINGKIYQNIRQISIEELKKHYNAIQAPASHAFTDQHETKIAYEFSSKDSNALTQTYQLKTGMPEFYNEIHKNGTITYVRFPKVHFEYTLKTTPTTVSLSSIPKVLNINREVYKHFFVYSCGNICYNKNELKAHLGREFGNEYAYTQSTQRAFVELIELPKKTLRFGLMGSMSSVHSTSTLTDHIDPKPIDNRIRYVNKIS